MAESERLLTLLENLLEVQIDARVAQDLASKDPSRRDRLSSVVVHLKLAAEHLLVLYGEAVLAEHLHGEISVHEPISS